MLQILSLTSTTHTNAYQHNNVVWKKCIPLVHKIIFVFPNLILTLSISLSLFSVALCLSRFGLKFIIMMCIVVWLYKMQFMHECIFYSRTHSLTDTHSNIVSYVFIKKMRKLWSSLTLSLPVNSIWFTQNTHAFILFSLLTIVVANFSMPVYD